ncbi:MAG: Mrp/NBP35 family ATP-binding protein [Bacteroidales bacterium]|nr:Mrp/NBP35 family ATP-binding protein [Bacteroidales bacterium]
MKVTNTQVEIALSHVDDPDLGRSLTQLGMIQNIVTGENSVAFDLVLTTPACPMKQKMKDDCIEAIHSYIDPSIDVTVNFKAKVLPAINKNELFPGVKNIIVVASGKGGVGKSTVAVNLAIALSKAGAKVGLVDADCYGPSIPILFDLKREDIMGEEHDGKMYMLPLEKYGIKLMSIGFMVDPNKALVWRGPMASNAVKQMLTDTYWGEIDYLVVDMPPGTGDIQLTIAQTLPVSGAVIVSTPQQVALADVVRGVEMFLNNDIKIPVLGFVENMAYFTPAELPNNKYYIFGRQGCRNLAEEMNIPLLGEIPLVQSIAENGDKGTPTALDDNSVEGKAFKALAENVAKELSIINSKK